MPFLELVQQLTGSPLRADAWVRELEEPLEKKVTKPATVLEADSKAARKPHVAAISIACSRHALAIWRAGSSGESSPLPPEVSLLVVMPASAAGGGAG